MHINTSEEVLARLRAHEPFQNIRTEVRSVSKLYDVTGQYLDELEVEVERKRGEVSKLDEEESAVKARVEALRVELGSLEEEKLELDQENTRLRNEVSERTTELVSLQARVQRFREQGFTADIMQKLAPMVETGGEELLKRVENTVKYQQTLKDFACLKRRYASLLRRVRVAKREKEKAHDSVISLKNQADELRLRVRPVKDALDTVVWLVKKGYTNEDIRALSYGLDFLGVEGDADLSISRLVTGLKMQRNLVILTEKTKRAYREYNELESAIKDAKSTLATDKDVTEKTINEVKSVSLQAIQSTTKESSMAFAAICKKFNISAEASLQDFGVRAEEKVRWLEEQYRQRREIDEQKMLFEKTLTYGQFAQGIFESDEYLSTVSLSWMLRLARRLQLWIRTKLPNGTVSPSESALQKQFGLMRFQPYNLATLTELVCEGLEAVSSKENATMNGAKAGANSCQG